MRRRKPRLSNLTAGFIGVILVAFIAVLVFDKGLPIGGSQFKLRAMFTSVTNIGT